ncbi:MAG: glycine cleavage system regulatory protein [Cocleimonas sp.]
MRIQVEGEDMHVSLIITIMAADRPGLVSSISEVLESHSGNWSESSMAHLAGRFVGLLQVSVPEENVDALSTALDNLQADDGLKILIETAEPNNKKPPTKTLNVEILCQDRIGIINDVTEVLAKLSVNIEELDSSVKEASMSGGMLFCANMRLGLPEGVDADAVEDSLEEMSDQLMIDINLS